MIEENYKVELSDIADSVCKFLQTLHSDSFSKERDRWLSLTDFSSYINYSFACIWDKAFLKVINEWRFNK